MIQSVAAVDHSAIASAPRNVVAAVDDQSDFMSTLKSVATGAIDQLGHAERVSISALQGRATAREVVDSVMRAEQTLQTALALRDKTVSAIQEITRMSI